MADGDFDALRRSREDNALRFYLVFMEPLEGAGDRSAIRPLHFAFVQRMEDDGHLLAGGPIVDDETGKTTGRGLFVLRGASAKAVEEIVRHDPFVVNGFRRYEIRPWRMAEGDVLPLLKGEAH